MDGVALARITGGSSTDADVEHDHHEALVEKKARATRDWVASSELVSARIQLAVIGGLMVIFALAPAPVDRAGTLTTYTSQILTGLLVLAVVRWLLPGEMTFRFAVQTALSVADAVLLCLLVYSYHLQYAIPLAAVLKAPTFGYFFFMLSLRAISLQPVNVLATGFSLAIGWGVLTMFAAMQTPPQGGFAQYVTSSSLLVGAEVDRCIMIVLTTAVLAVGACRARTLLKDLDLMSDTAKQAEVDSVLQSQFRKISAKVAHEIRNPLNTIHTSSLVLARKAREAGAPVEKPMARIANSIGRCENVINDMMEIAGNLARERIVEKADDWLEALLKSDISSIGEGPRIELHRGAEFVYITINEQEMTNAIIRLLVNSSEAIARKTKQNPAFGPGRIIVQTSVDTQHYYIRIRDDGCGIDADQIDAVQQPLVTSKGFGVGLGLPIARRVIEAHRGSLQLSSDEETGTTAEIRLPVT